ncbi:MAG: DUF3305 domain-containing protein [Gammaproteobacteria bacterium]|nr:DUF3305 domain-containing protein [Gammaproteobacteria bacterium]
MSGPIHRAGPDSAPAPAFTFTESDREVRIPVAVVLQRTIERAKRWVLPQWRVFAVVAGEHIPRHRQAVLIHDDGIHRRYLHGGMMLRLYKDGGEGYWYNLLSERPYLFVVCDGEHGDSEVLPAFITANRDEANGYMEVDRLVLPAPMPANMCDILERYVISHYRPAGKKKRARQEWAQESVYAKRPRQTR